MRQSRLATDRAYALCWPLAVVAGVLLVNLPALVHLVDVNPLGMLADATSHASKGLLTGGPGIDVNIGYTAQALGHRAALDWLHGTVPWWNPLEGIGSPLATEMQSAAFFPPVLLFALPDGSLYFHVCLEIAAGLATWCLVRELGMSPAVATVGGLLFGLCGTFDWLWHAPMNPVPLLPLALFGVERTFRRPHSDWGWIVLAVALALSLYAGFPETAYLDLLFVLAWVGLRLAQSQVRLRVAVRYLLGGLTGLMLSLPLAIPAAEYLPYASTAMNSSGIGYAHLGGTDLPALGLPYLYGPIGAFDRISPALTHFWGAAGGFLSATTIALAVAGLLGSRRDAGLRYLLGGGGLVMLLWSLGVEPFASLTGVLPYMSHVWVSRYSGPVWEMAAVLAACFGLDAVGPDRRFRAALLAGSAATLALGAATVLGPAGSLAAAISQAASGARIWAVVSVAWSAGAVALITLVALVRRNGWSRALVGVLLVLDAGSLAFLPQLSAPRAVTIDLAPARFLARHLGLGRFYSFSAYHPNYGSYLGIASIDTTDAPVPQAWADEITAKLGPNMVPWRFDGANPADRAGPSPATQALTDIRAYEALDVRYFVVHDPVAPAFTDRTLHPLGLRKVFNDGLVTIFALPDPRPYFNTVGASCGVRPRARDAAVVTCSAPANLVRSELDLPGWSVTVNGHPAQVLDYQRLLTAVRVPAGRSVVRFSYTPVGLPAALAGFAAGLLLLIGVPAGRRLASRHPDNPPAKADRPEAVAAPQA